MSRKVLKAKRPGSSSTSVSSSIPSSLLSDAGDDKQTHTRRSVLRGSFHFFEQHLWLAPFANFIPFISSTFDDTFRERNILIEEIAPILQQRGKQLGVHVVLIDMRMGIPDQSFADHKTFFCCKREILRCLNESSGLCFVSLQSSRYGTMFLPSTLPKSIFEGRLKTQSTEANALAQKWYELDENAIDVIYR